MHIKPFRAVYPKLEFIASPDSFFSTVKEDYPAYKQDGFFIKTDTDAFYIYQILTPRRRYLGLIAASDVQDFLDGNILKHEDTLTALEQVQMHLLFRRNAVVKPVLLTYPKVDEIEQWMEDYIKSGSSFFSIDFEFEEEHHRLWKVEDAADIAHLKRLFAEKIPKTYIADGHHRTSTSALMYEKSKDTDPEKYRYFLTAFFSFSDLEIFDYNRIVRGLNDNTDAMFMAKLSQVFDIEVMSAPGKPSKKHELVMFFNHSWYRLNWRVKVLEKYTGRPVLLDATLLNEQVLAPILGIADERNDSRIKYMEGPKGIEGVREIVLRNENRVGFLLYPVGWDDFLKIADMGRIMPPKSTWFEPRMKNGIIVQEI